MERRHHLRKVYGQAWDTWDADLLISSLAPGFVFEDPGYPRPVTAETIADYMAGWHARVRALGGTGEIGSRDRISVDQDGAFISWHWWSFVGTALEGAAVTRTTDEGVQYERMTYNGRPPFALTGTRSGTLAADAAAPWHDWHSGSKPSPDPVPRYKVLFGSEVSDTRGLCQGILEYPPGQRCRAHWHTPAETYFVLEGSCVGHVEGMRLTAGTGDAIHVPSRAVHWFENPGADTLRVLWTLNCNGVDDIDFTHIE